jgi:hypothetical protein
VSVRDAKPEARLKLLIRFRSKQFALCAPIEGQTGVVHHPVRGELRRMPAVQDRRDNVGGEEGEPDETRNVGTADPLLCGDLSQG